MPEGIVKPRCPVCGKPYLGAACHCKESRRFLVLRCACGRGAVDVFVASSDEEQPLCKLHLKKAMKLRVSQRGDFQQELFSSLESYSPPHAPAPSRQPDKRRNPLGLTERQDQVARLSHLPRKQIAERLGLSENTVKAHLRNIANRVGMRRRREIARLVEEEGDAESR